MTAAQSAELPPRGPRRSRLWRWWNIHVISDIDHAAILQQVIEESGWSGRYAFFILISAGIAMLGLLIPSVAVVIGAMLLSPLMMPIMGLGFGIATFDFAEMRRAAFALAAGCAMAVALCVVMVALSPVQTVTGEIAARTQPTFFDLLVALLSAVAGAYALIRGRGGTVVGVAIAIALMPPLAVVGFGIATWNWTIFSGALLLFLTNAVTIALTAALMARLYGFGSHLSPKHTWWQILLFVGGLGILAVPLSAALRQIAFEAVAQRQVRDTMRRYFPQGSRLSQVDIDFSHQPMRVRAIMLTPEVDPKADAVLAQQLEQRLSRPVDIHVDQLRISLDSGAAEAAQLAHAAELRPAEDGRDRAIAELALIAGVEPAAVTSEPDGRTVSAVAAPLPGLGVAGYHALEQRAARAILGWQVRLAPPPEAALPDIAIEQGVIGVGALDEAGWASARRAAPLLVRGGTAAQRDAVAAGIVARGGAAEAGDGGGGLRLEWRPPEEPAAG